MLLYKLTDKDNQTFGNTPWGEGVEHTASGAGELCGPGWIHAYTDPLLAILLNPMHGAFRDPNLWESDGDVGKTDHGLKVGCTRLRTMRVLPMPAVSIVQSVRFGILCGMAVYEEPMWAKWAQDWLSGADRTFEAARAAEDAAAAWSVAAWAARAAAEVQTIDLVAIAHQAMEGED